MEAYVDEVSDKPLVGKIPQSSKIKKEKIYPETGLIEWRLSNGIRVILKPTDFKNDELQFQGFSTGGTSLLRDDDYIFRQLSCRCNFFKWCQENLI